MDFSDAIINGVPLLFVVGGLVAFAKTLGLKGKALTVLSAVLGLGVGAASQISLHGLPVDFAGWFGLAIYGLALGVVTSGVYDLVKRDMLGK